MVELVEIPIFRQIFTKFKFFRFQNRASYLYQLCQDDLILKWAYLKKISANAFWFSAKNGDFCGTSVRPILNPENGVASNWIYPRVKMAAELRTQIIFTAFPITDYLFLRILLNF